MSAADRAADKAVYTAAEAAERAGVAYSTMREHIRAGKVRAVRRGRAFHITDQELRRAYPGAFAADSAAEAAEAAEPTARAAERDELRAEIKRLHAHLEHLEAQNERLTILLGNEQAYRLQSGPRALPRPCGAPLTWIARLFGRRDG